MNTLEIQVKGDNGKVVETRHLDVNDMVFNDVQLLAKAFRMPVGEFLSSINPDAIGTQDELHHACEMLLKFAKSDVKDRFFRLAGADTAQVK